MKLDKNYNPYNSEDNIYSDSFDEIVELVAIAREKGTITTEEAKLVLDIAFKKQNRKEIHDFFEHIFANSNNKVKHTLFLHLKTNHTSYAS